MSETEYIAPVIFHVKGKPASQILRINVKEIAEFHQRYIFKVFWNRSTSAEQRIYEIESAIYSLFSIIARWIF
jgi:hypothetical protein